MTARKNVRAGSTDAHARTRNRSNAAAIAAALAFYSGTRPPPDPQKDAAAGAGTPAADDGDFDNRRDQHTGPAGEIQPAAQRDLCRHRIGRSHGG